MDIQTVKLQENGYLVNGSIFVPDDPGNRHYREVQEWINAGNTPEPIQTPAEQAEEELQAHNEEKERRLKETDYTQLMDENALLTSQQQSDIATYRQAVRDTTVGNSFPHLPAWYTGR